MILFGMFFSALIQFIVVGAYILIASFILWMAVDAAKQDRFWWVVCILGAPVVGAAVYYATEKKHEYVKIESHHIHESETEEQHEVAHKKRARKSVVKESSKVETPIVATLVEPTPEETKPEEHSQKEESSVTEEEK
jgi:ABC-type nickel/cobalt efflux system permease component RcnA